jgi:8-oxo-dGTP pyrophosphatase MutT (NUDIX family)
VIKQRIQELLSSRDKKSLDIPGSIHSAVLLPLFCKDGELHILFTKRTDLVKTHKGHICFPGGGCEEDDDTPAFTALRETEEEIGMGPDEVEIIGELDDVASYTTNYIISPFVGFITYPFDFVLNEHEAERVIEAPVSALLRTDSVNKASEFMEGVPVTSYFYRYKGDIIWGATARILTQFLVIYRQADTEAAGSASTQPGQAI